MARCTSSAARSVVALSALLLAADPVAADDPTLMVCPLALAEERTDLQDAALEVELARSALTAYEKIYEQVAELAAADAIDRMTYLRTRYDRDAARLALERAELLLARQEALIEHLSLACGEVGADAKGGDRNRELRRLYRLYLRAECDQQAKAVEVAETNLEFNRVWLESIVELRQQVSTKSDLILAELDVELEEQRREDARRRTAACRSILEALAGTKLSALEATEEAAR
jgi:hypothetical protein